MNSFIYDIPVKVYFGKDQLENLGKELEQYGKKVLLVYGGGSIKRIGLYDSVVKQIEDSGLEIFELSGIDPNPRIESVRKGADICKENKIDMVLAVGGGSSIDAAKWIAAAACADFDAWDFFTKNAPVNNALPIITILTIAATGSEMDPGGVISNPETKDKLGRLDMKLLPKASFLDPTVTYSVSAYQTACGAADMLSHIMEVYFDMDPGMYMLDCFMEGMMKTIIRYAPIAIKEPDNYEARANLMWTSSWAINGLLRGGRNIAWSCHPIEHEISAIYDVTHGHGLAILTPKWLRYCLDDITLAKYVQFGTNVFGIDSSLSPLEIANKSIDMLEKFLFDGLGLSRTLTSIGVKTEDFSIMAKKACMNSVIPGFKPLNQHDIENILNLCV